MHHSTTSPEEVESEPMYTPAEYAQFAALRRDLRAMRLERDTPTIATAVAIAPLLAHARAYLATFRPRVCPACGHVFSPAGRSDPRCLDCTHAGARAPLPIGGD